MFMEAFVHLLGLGGGVGVWGPALPGLAWFLFAWLLGVIV